MNYSILFVTCGTYKRLLRERTFEESDANVIYILLYNKETSKTSEEIETPGAFSCVLQCIHVEQEDTPIKYKL
ncbi:hypothetical protein T06_11742 [Trichinella sp. T6]|nr:hypothetical protein T06_11742 [Trichinella sp. T6]